MQNPIVVTGAAGFIGTNVVRALNARGRRDVIVVDRLGRDEKWRNLVDQSFADYLDLEDFRARVRRDELPALAAVIHLGACSSTTETDADYLMDNNFAYTRELCEWCVRHGVRFVYASSAATYGDGTRGYDDDHALLRDLRPLNMYGYSKHVFDLWAQNKGLLDRIAGLKYFNVYGPWEDHKGDMRSVVHKAYHQILETGKVQLFKSHRDDYEDGGQVRDFVWVDDAVRQTLWLADHREVNGVFNCGTGRARSWVDLARAVFAALGREPRIEFVEMPAHLRAKYQYHTCADLHKVRRAGYDTPFTELEDGIQAYVREYLLDRFPPEPA
ncbi:MAG TPA: ADP-glyceromanno-heptose 6-epimerase [Candidatus Krumholzibacteria bacterium]|mgnify:CR=1 FL=1|nr:ADP-glyceromanno-heptose 6-epimerase [Candidatus Krumholzibacteria bacterium]HRX50008.1 ADP-glyceromanno-heptose 6-epimerase [Candidatus Krumholzibacteria bacterium]